MDGWYSLVFWFQSLANCYRRTSTAFSVTSPIQRVVTTSILLLMVATIIPYQFAYLVLCIVQLATCVRALRLAWDTVCIPPAIFEHALLTQYTAFTIQRQFLQLHPFPSLTHALDPSDQSPSSGRLDPQPRRPLADALLLTPQHT